MCVVVAVFEDHMDDPVLNHALIVENRPYPSSETDLRPAFLIADSSISTQV